MTATLLAVPNLSLSSEADALEVFRGLDPQGDLVVLNESFDPDHGRSVHTLASVQGQLARRLSSVFAGILQKEGLRQSAGVHPRVGLIDVAPVVHIRDADRGPALAEALVLANLIGQLGVPVFLYGELAAGRTRADLRRGGTEGLQKRVHEGELSPDFGPARITDELGATLVCARPPLVAFNLVLSSGSTIDQARSAAALVREGGDLGLRGVRAIGLELPQQGVVQISMNLEDPQESDVADVLNVLAPIVSIDHGELIGLAPEAVIDRIPADLPMPGLDPQLQSIEGSLRFNGIDI